MHAYTVLQTKKIVLSNEGKLVKRLLIILYKVYYSKFKLIKLTFDIDNGKRNGRKRLELIQNDTMKI